MTTRHNLSYADELYTGSLYRPGEARRGVRMIPITLVDYGAIVTADPNGVCETQAANTDGVLDGALVSGGVATFDVPRNVVAAWTTAAVLTVTGTDEHGKVMVESSASGTSLTGKKAFKTVTAVSASTAITGLTVGSGVVIGLPVLTTSAGFIFTAMADGVDELATSTVVVGDATTATATTGDVRGTITFATTPNSTVEFSVLMAVVNTNKSALGAAQFAG